MSHDHVHPVFQPILARIAGDTSRAQLVAAIRNPPPAPAAIQRAEAAISAEMWSDKPLGDRTKLDRWSAEARKHFSKAAEALAAFSIVIGGAVLIAAASLIG